MVTLTQPFQLIGVKDIYIYLGRNILSLLNSNIVKEVLKYQKTRLVRLFIYILMKFYYQDF